ncbi:hypothetical protein [Marinitoga aeolica]|uniref:DUF5050 domain-containing protein n=1 Tax=Marinitoga aeolica TaxID=2809031 RepID=A0ABY8PST4_9BACT|nr:hypothetical protein [Marinitoga aeolica]WGS65691.1 hypothetical protein JRV97_03825 [Marinitoga aeolica]
MKKGLFVVIILLVIFFITVFSIFSSTGDDVISYEKVEYNSLTYPGDDINIVYMNKGNFTVDDDGNLYYLSPIYNITKNKHQIFISKFNVLSKKIKYEFLDGKIFEKKDNIGIIKGALTIDNGILYYKGAKGILSIKDNNVTFTSFSEKLNWDYADGDFVHVDDGFWIISEIIYRVGSKYYLYKYKNEDNKLIIDKTIETNEVILNITKYKDDVYVFCHDAESGEYNLYRIKNNALENIYTIYGNKFKSSGYYASNANPDKKYYWYNIDFISIVDNKAFLKGKLESSDKNNLIEIDLNTGKENYYDLYPNYQLDYAADTQYIMKKINGKYYLFIKSRNDDPNNLKIFSITKR